MKRILVVDDEEQIRNMLKKVLERKGYQVAIAANGAEALRLFNQQPAELVITDLTMPEKNGMETISELMRTHPNTKVIAISGGGDRFPEYFLPRAMDAGATQALKKPIRAQQLVAAVSGLIGDAGNFQFN